MPHGLAATPAGVASNPRAGDHRCGQSVYASPVAVSRLNSGYDFVPMSQSEGTIAVPGGTVWFKRVGGGPGLPLLAVHGGPGLPHNYLLSLQRLADEREVIFWDQLGCGNSESPSNAGLWTVDRSVAEMDAVIGGLGLERFHLFGNSWGGMLAQQYVLDVASTAVSLTISNSIASIPQFAEMVARLKQDLDRATQSAIDRHEAAGTTSSPEYQDAIRTWNETYLCRVQPWPHDLQDAFVRMGTEVFETMFGPSDFHIVGTISSWDVFDRLPEIVLPTLVVAGRYDECAHEHMWEMHRRIRNSRFELFESSSHMPFIEEPQRFDGVLRDFLRHHDDVGAGQAAR
jgi:proline iminopeptidase